jgi:hypothetical protein
MLSPASPNVWRFPQYLAAQPAGAMILKTDQKIFSFSQQGPLTVQMAAGCAAALQHRTLIAKTDENRALEGH